MARKIVVVDDDWDLCETLATALGERGYEVRAVHNGLKLVSALRVDRPDLIVLDVMMSWINGFDLCQAIKRNPDFTAIPVVFVSARCEAGDVRRGLEAGAADYLTKPIDLAVLVARVERLVGPTAFRSAPPS